MADPRALPGYGLLMLHPGYALAVAASRSAPRPVDRRAVHRVLDAIAAVAAERGTALLQGGEAAIPPPALAAVLGTPWIGDLGTARCEAGQQSQPGRHQKNAPHGG